MAKADLVSINSKEEQDFLDKTFASYNLYRGSFWTGLKKNDKNEFHWTDDSHLTYQDWVNNKPNLNFSCVRSSLKNSVRSSWESADCGDKNFFVCKVKRGKFFCFFFYI